MSGIKRLLEQLQETDDGEETSLPPEIIVVEVKKANNKDKGVSDADHYTG